MINGIISVIRSQNNTQGETRVKQGTPPSLLVPHPLSLMKRPSASQFLFCPSALHSQRGAIDNDDGDNFRNGAEQTADPYAPRLETDVCDICSRVL